MTKFLNREEILGAEDVLTDVVSVPEWGGDVRIRGLDAEQYIGMGFDLRGDGQEIDAEKAKRMMPTIVAMGVIDEDGESLFTGKDVEALAKKSFKVIDQLSTRILELSGLRTTEEDDGKN